MKPNPNLKMPTDHIESLKIGSNVELQGLNRVEYNGDKGVVTHGFDTKTGRIQVLHFHKTNPKGKIVRIKPENIKLSDIHVKLVTSSKSRKKKVLKATKRINKGELVFCEKPILQSVRRDHLDKIGLGFTAHFCDDSFLSLLCAFVAYDELDAGTRELINQFSAPQTGSTEFNDIIRARINPLIMEQPDFMKNFVRNKSEYLEFTARMVVNAFSYRGGTSSCEMLYQMGSWLSHSCDPNVRYDFKRNKGFGTFFASRDIEAGEVMTYSYLPSRYPRFMRREMLKQHWFFDCECDACTSGIDKCRALPCPRCLPSTQSSAEARVIEGFIFCDQSKVASGEPWVCFRCNNQFSTEATGLDEALEYQRAMQAQNFEAKHQTITKINFNEAKHDWEMDLSLFGPCHSTTMVREKILCRVIIGGRGNESTPNDIEKHVKNLKRYATLMSDDLDNEHCALIVRLVDYVVKNVPSLLPFGIRCLRYTLESVPNRSWDEGYRQICVRLAKFEESKQQQSGVNEKDTLVSDEQLKSLMNSLSQSLQNPNTE